MTDYTWTLDYFLQATGECEWADRIERIIFNAGMGSVTKDFRALQYFSSVNQILATEVGTGATGTYVTLNRTFRTGDIGS